MFTNTPDPSELYIFTAPLPTASGNEKNAVAAGPARTFSHRMMAQTPIKTKSGTVRITDSKVFPVSKTIAAALVEVEPGGMREPYNGTRTPTNGSTTSRGKRGWAFLRPKGRLGPSIIKRTTLAMSRSLWAITSRILAIRRSGFSSCSRATITPDISLDQWLAQTPPELVTAHLRTDPQFISSLRKEKVPVVPA